MAFENFGVRTLVTALFAPFILLCAWKGGYIFLALVSSIVLLGINEFYDLAVQKVTTPQKYVGIVAGVISCLMMYATQTEHLWIVLSVTFIVIVVFELFRNQVAPILNIATTLMGVFFAGIFPGFLILIREAPQKFSLGYQLGGLLVILIFVCVWVCDTSAYLLGSRIGKHKLFERVSPNKTVEGTAAGFIFSILTAWLCGVTFLNGVDLIDALAIGAICGSVGQVSDLIESLLKRDARVKDSSSLIPGHGGILDRFDSEILVAPAVYFYLFCFVF